MQWYAFASKKRKTISFWTNTGKKTYFLVADCTDPILKGGSVSGFTEEKRTNGMWPHRVIAYATCDGATSHTVDCISGTWRGFPDCTGSNNILLQNWDVEKLIVWQPIIGLISK